MRARQPKPCKQSTDHSNIKQQEKRQRHNAIRDLQTPENGHIKYNEAPIERLTDIVAPTDMPNPIVQIVLNNINDVQPADSRTTSNQPEANNPNQTERNSIYEDIRTHPRLIDPSHQLHRKTTEHKHSVVTFQILSDLLEGPPRTEDTKTKNNNHRTEQQPEGHQSF